MPFSKSELKDIVEFTTFKKWDKIYFKQFMQTLGPVLKDPLGQKIFSIENVYRVIDDDNDGSVNSSELKDIIQIIFGMKMT